eukprot:129828_1
MEELIRFKLLSHSLSQNEYEILLSKIIKLIDKNTLIPGLFYYFLKNQSERMKIQEINDQISEIIQQRFKTKETGKSPLPTPQIDNINISLINEISSYLDLKSLTYFERCNRNIFVASRSPTQLHTIDDNTLTHYVDYCKDNNQLINPNRFTNIQSLTMADGYYHFSEWPLPKANKIHKIVHYPYDGAPNLYESHHINLNNIDTLTISDPEDLSEEYIVELLKSLPNLKNMELTDFNFKQITFDDKDKLTVLSKLKCLSLNYFYNEFHNNNNNNNENKENDDDDKKELTIFDVCNAQQLKSLHTDFDINDMIKCKKYINLEELCLKIKRVNNMLIEMIKCFPKLERIYLNIDFDQNSNNEHKGIEIFLNLLF